MNAATASVWPLNALTIRISRADVTVKFSVPSQLSNPLLLVAVPSKIELAKAAA